MAGVGPSLAVDLVGLRLPSPVMVASGCFGTGRELAELIDTSALGGVVSRSVTLRPRQGAPGPRVTETPSGVLWTSGLQNSGAEAFLADELPDLVGCGAPVFVSVAGSSREEYVHVARLVQQAAGVVALELLLDCPDEELGRPSFAARPERAAEVVGAVARLAPVPVFAKLPALLPDLADTARSCVRAGAHGLTVVGGIPGMAVDTRGLRPALGAVTGFLSGPAIRPLAVRAVFEVARAVPGVPILGSGGVASPEDAMELMLAGAWVVQVGTALFVEPSAPLVIAEGVRTYLKIRGWGSPADVRGRLRLPAAERES